MAFDPSPLLCVGKLCCVFTHKLVTKIIVYNCKTAFLDLKSPPLEFFSPRKFTEIGEHGRCVSRTFNQLRNLQ